MKTLNLLRLSIVIMCFAFLANCAGFDSTTEDKFNEVTFSDYLDDDQKSYTIDTLPGDITFKMEDQPIQIKSTAANSTENPSAAGVLIASNTSSDNASIMPNDTVIKPIKIEPARTRQVAIQRSSADIGFIKESPNETLPIVKNSPSTISNRIVNVLSNTKSSYSDVTQESVAFAQDFILDVDYLSRKQVMKSTTYWGGIGYRSARILVVASNMGYTISDRALFRAYTIMFRSGEGLPNNLDEHLSYIYRALAIQQRNPKVEPDINKYVWVNFPYLMTWEYLRKGGHVNYAYLESVIVDARAKNWPEIESYKFVRPLEGYAQQLLSNFYTMADYRLFLQGAIDNFNLPIVQCIAERNRWNIKKSNRGNYQSKDPNFNWNNCGYI